MSEGGGRGEEEDEKSCEDGKRGEGSSSRGFGRHAVYGEKSVVGSRKEVVQKQMSS